MGKLGVGVGEEFPIDDGKPRDPENRDPPKDAERPHGERQHAYDEWQRAHEDWHRAQREEWLKFQDEWKKRREEFHAKRRQWRDEWHEKQRQWREEWRKRREEFRAEMRQRYGAPPEHWHDHWHDHWTWGPEDGRIVAGLIAILGTVALAILIFSHFVLFLGLLVLGALWFAWRGRFDHFHFDKGHFDNGHLGNGGVPTSPADAPKS
jgi:hypothetical protein